MIISGALFFIRMGAVWCKNIKKSLSLMLVNLTLEKKFIHNTREDSSLTLEKI